MFSKLLEKVAEMYNYLALDAATPPAGTSGIDTSGTTGFLDQLGTYVGDGAGLDFFYFIGIVLIVVVCAYVILFRIIIPASRDEDNQKVAFVQVIKTNGIKIGLILLAALAFALLLSSILA